MNESGTERGIRREELRRKVGNIEEREPGSKDDKDIMRKEEVRASVFHSLGPP